MHSEEQADIRGEYWIQDGSVDYADGDIGDRNHEGIATDHVFGQYGEQIISLAKKLGLAQEGQSYEGYDGGYDTEAISGLLSSIWDKLTIGDENEEEPDPSTLMNDQQAEQYLEQYIEANKDAMQILWGGGDSRLYVMMYEGWIAVRENNAELYGYDQQKQDSLASGLGDILDQEGISDTIPPENVELSVYDHKTKRHWNVTLADLENSPQAHAQTPALSAYKKSFGAGKDSEENKYSNPTKSQPNKWTAAAQKAGVIGPGQQFWRGTSETKYPSFLEWYKKKNKVR